jgi:hypothetical protein
MFDGREQLFFVIQTREHFQDTVIVNLVQPNQGWHLGESHRAEILILAEWEGMDLTQLSLQVFEVGEIEDHFLILVNA